MKIDTKSIENYENMTPEEKVQALEGFEMNDNEAKYKELISKANSEAKKYKDQMRAAEEKLNSQLSEEERTQKETEERYKAIEEENARLKRDMTISQKTAFYLNMGFDGDLAKETATAFVDGDFETVEKNELGWRKNFERDIRADVVRQTPHPQNAGGIGGLTKDQIMKETNAIKRQQMIAENMELFL